MSKVYIARGHGRKPDGGFDPGAAGRDEGGGLWTEQKMADIAAPVVTSILRGVGVTVKDEGTDDPNFVGSITAANAWGADITVSIHADWTGGREFHMLHWPGSTEGIKLSQEIYDAVKRSGHPVDTKGLYPRDDLSLLKRTDHPAVIVEMGRIADDEIDTKEEIEALARTVAVGIAAYLGKTVQPEPEPVQPPVTADNKSVFLPVLVQVRGSKKVYQAWGRYLTHVPSPEVAAILNTNWRANVREITEKEFELFTVVTSLGDGTTLSEVDSLVKKRLEVHAEDPDAHHD